MTGAGPRTTGAETAPWDISFLRVGVLVTAAATAVAAPVAGLIGGWSARGRCAGRRRRRDGVLLRLRGGDRPRGRIDDALTLPAALGTFLVKALILFAVLGPIPADGWLDRLALAWTVIVGALLWSAVQARWVWTRQLYYVTPPPPVPRASVGAPGRPSQDPEKPAPRA